MVDRSNRISGSALRLAARLAETPGAGGLLYRQAARDLGVDRLKRHDVPDDVRPYCPSHLGRAARSMTTTGTEGDAEPLR